ncbi:MAG TPA: hypothetical protein VH596_11255 [Terriglobales bacterium]
MTRRTLFLAAIMVLASLGAGAQNTPQQDSATQQTNIQQTNNNASQSTAASQPSQPDSRTTAPNEQTPAVSNGQLPQTSTILPLLGLIGLGSLVAGFFARR